MRTYRPRGIFLLTALALFLIGSMSGDSNGQPDVQAPVNPRLDSIRVRVERLKAATDSLNATYEREILPIERALLRYRQNDTVLVRRIAVALARNARENGLDAHLLAGVLLVENPWLNPDTASFVGATGLMQVMPLHAGGWGCGSDDLTDVESNICHGARILAWNLAETDGDLERALLRYNGCVRGSNTPDCHLYPRKVGRLADRVRRIARQPEAVALNG